MAVFKREWLVCVSIDVDSRTKNFNNISMIRFVEPRTIFAIDGFKSSTITSGITPEASGVILAVEVCL